MLVILGGLPATGKSTIAKALSAKRAATYVRVDEIEQAVLNETGEDAGRLGYVVAQTIAASNLQLGLEVIADSVNPIEASRRGWRDAAQRSGCSSIEVEVVCSDVQIHRSRAEQRPTDVDGLVHPTWTEISERNFEPWGSAHLRLDTSILEVDGAVAAIEAQIAQVHG